MIAIIFTLRLKCSLIALLILLLILLSFGNVLHIVTGLLTSDDEYDCIERNLCIMPVKYSHLNYNYDDDDMANEILITFYAYYIVPR